MKKIKIALLGLGNVGRGVFTILQQNKDEIMKRSGYEIEVSKVLVRDVTKNRGVAVPEEVFLTAPAPITAELTILFTSFPDISVSALFTYNTHSILYM